MTSMDKMAEENSQDSDTVRYSEFCSADIDACSLFKPLSKVEKRPRSEISVIKADYLDFTSALKLIVSDWLNGSIGSGAPTEPWELDAVRKINNLNSSCVKNRSQIPDKIKAVYDQLVAIKVPGHLRIVTSHRLWIRGTFRVLKLAGVKFSDSMDNLIWRHDLSKYSHKEVLGYAIMFGKGRVDFRSLQDADEKLEWNTSLNNHYAHNPHHPEYFYPPNADGIRTKDNSIRKLDHEYGEDFLIESAIDMLAANGERNLVDDQAISVKKWFDLADRFYKRYETSDGNFVRETIQSWERCLQEFLATQGNSGILRDIFDSRAIVYA